MLPPPPLLEDLLGAQGCRGLVEDGNGGISGHDRGVCHRERTTADGVLCVLHARDMSNSCSIAELPQAGRGVAGVGIALTGVEAPVVNCASGGAFIKQARTCCPGSTTRRGCTPWQPPVS